MKIILITTFSLFAFCSFAQVTSLSVFDEVKVLSTEEATTTTYSWEDWKVKEMGNSKSPELWFTEPYKLKDEDYEGLTDIIIRGEGFTKIPQRKFRINYYKDGTVIIQRKIKQTVPLIRLKSREKQMEELIRLKKEYLLNDSLYVEAGNRILGTFVDKDITVVKLDTILIDSKITKIITK